MLIVRNEVSRPARRNGIELPAEKGPDGRIFGVPDRVYSVASWHGPRQPAIEKRSRTSTFRGVVIWALPRGRREYRNSQQCRLIPTAASPQPKDWLCASCGSPRDGGILAQWPRHRAAEVWRIGANPGTAAWSSLATWGARPGTHARPRLRSWPLNRRSGCSSAEPYPPSRPVAIVAAPWLGANRPLKLSRLGKPGGAR